MSKNIILEVKNLKKSFGDFVAIDDVSFELQEGHILGFLGPNGAGKSTTIFCLLGLILPDAGSIKIFSEDVTKKRSQIMEKVNYVSAEFNLPWNLTVWQSLFVFSKIYSIPIARKRIEELLDLFEITHLKDKMFRDLSLGQRARANLCKGFLNHPKLLLLDEPMASMDPDVVDKGINLIKQIQKEEGISIVYTSHNMWEIEEISNNVIFINHGKIVASGTPLELTKQVLSSSSKEANLREVFIHISRNKDNESS